MKRQESEEKEGERNEVLKSLEGDIDEVEQDLVSYIPLCEIEVEWQRVQRKLLDMNSAEFWLKKAEGAIKKFKAKEAIGLYK